MWMLENVQRSIREPHCANLMHSDLDAREVSDYREDEVDVSTAVDALKLPEKCYALRRNLPREAKIL